jgi:hypothetical protein
MDSPPPLPPMKYKYAVTFQRFRYPAQQGKNKYMFTREGCTVLHYQRLRNMIVQSPLLRSCDLCKYQRSVSY